MKSYLVLRYISFIFIIGSIIIYSIINNHEIRFGCIMFTILGIYALINSKINKHRFYK